MTGDNRVVQGLWVGGRLSALERLCILSFCAHGHEFHLYRYDELQNVPRIGGLRLMDGADILPRAAIFHYRRRQSLAGFADRFRWELMRQRGGWYADMDVVCLRPLEMTVEIAMGYEGKGDSVNSAMMKFPRGHFMAAALADACANINKFAPWDTTRRKLKKIKRLMLLRRDHKYLGWGEAGGPRATTLAVRHFGLEEYVLPPHALYAQEHPLVRHFFDNRLRNTGTLDMMLSGTHAIHVMHHRLRKSGIDIDGKFPADSLYEVLKRRYPDAASGR